MRNNARVDDESLEALRRIAGDAAGVPSDLHSRLRGESLSELKADATSLARELGIGETPAQRRDGNGKYATDMNQLLRQAAGR